MSEVITKVAKIEDNGLPSTYNIGAYASNIIYKEGLSTYPLDLYLHNLNNTVGGLSTTINSLSTTVNNIPSIYATKQQLQQEKGNLLTYINNNGDRIDSLTSTVSYINYIGSPSTRGRWDGTLVPGVNDSEKISRITGITTLDKISGKINYLRSHPFIVLRYTTGSKTLSGNSVYIHKFAKGSFTSINQIKKADSTEPTEAEVLQYYKSVCVLFPEIRKGQPSRPNLDSYKIVTGSQYKTPIYPQRAFLDDEENPIVVVANQGSGQQSFYSLNLRVLAVLKSIGQ